MRILWITGNCYDFGVDFLYDGLRQLGHEVVAFPDPAHYHRTDPDGSHWREWSCEFTYPLDPPTDTAAIHARVLAGDFDVAVFTTLRDAGPATGKAVLAGTTVPVVALDMGDVRAHQPRAAYEKVIGRPLAAYFARESPTDEEVPLSFSFPARWATPSTVPRDIGVYFRACRINGLRDQVAAAITAAIPAAERTVHIYDWGQRSVPLSQYRDELRRSRVAVVVAGGGWDTARLWEAAGSGCALVVHTPPFHVSYWFPPSAVMAFTTADGCVEAVRHLLAHEDERRDRAARSYAHFLTHHTTTQRAAMFLRHLSFLGIA